MSYGYAPRYSARATAELRHLEVWLQEDVLDEVDRLVDSLPVPDVAQRLASGRTVDDLYRVVGGVKYYVFITTELDVAARELRVLSVGLFTDP